MTLKYSPRSMPFISRNNPEDENSEVLKELNKVSVQPYRSEENIFDQINSIINGKKPKYSSVADAVKDMQDRSGLTAYRDKIKIIAEKIKTAACSCASDGLNKVKVFEINPSIKDSFDTYIKETRGKLPIPSVIGRFKAIYRKDIPDESLWNEASLANYINSASIKIQKDNPDIEQTNNANLGHLPRLDDKDIHQSNYDALFSLNPAVNK